MWKSVKSIRCEEKSLVFISYTRNGTFEISRNIFEKEKYHLTLHKLLQFCHITRSRLAPQPKLSAAPVTLGANKQK